MQRHGTPQHNDGWRVVVVVVVVVVEHADLRGLGLAYLPSWWWSAPILSYSVVGLETWSKKGE